MYISYDCPLYMMNKPPPYAYLILVFIIDFYAYFFCQKTVGFQNYPSTEYDMGFCI